jgi:hypothetical protein
MDAKPIVLHDLTEILERFNNTKHTIEIASFPGNGYDEKQNMTHLYDEFIKVNIAKGFFAYKPFWSYIANIPDAHVIIELYITISPYDSKKAVYSAIACEYDTWLNDPINARYIELFGTEGYYSKSGIIKVLKCPMYYYFRMFDKKMWS